MFIFPLLVLPPELTLGSAGLKKGKKLREKGFLP
jgi:hypothetical protein